MTNKNYSNNNIKKDFDFQDYVKPSYCHVCCFHILNTTKCYHEKSEFHKIAQRLRNVSQEPIEDIKQKVVEYKMIQKYMKKTFLNDSSSSEEQQPEDIDDDTRCKIKHKSEVYTRELAHRAERYERTKSISMLVNTIKTTTKRLTTQQIHKFNIYIAKYPDNELLLSIQHLVPKKEQ